MSRLTIDITGQQHKALKAMAALEGKIVRQFALEKLFPPATDEDRDWGGIEDPHECRIEESAGGAVSSKTFDEIVEEELGAGEAP